ncbi:unnamed protein product [Psylliodes chrysocephalus]|uniref:Cathepsin propeptide inhibitor domain-containing protein n=1 Tax=Psylliodes chrysocephalus TaxID=3402493 RepID=A0A9P0CL34_9CUCU|nr:unnamed protein product [Psylliodes chrysocephala]
MLKFAILLLAAIAMASALTDQEKFSEFKTKFNKNYGTPEEEQHRLEVFLENSKKIDAHNEKFAKGEVSYSQGLNQFSDLTAEEWKNRNHGLKNTNAKTVV